MTLEGRRYHYDEVHRLMLSDYNKSYIVVTACTLARAAANYWCVQYLIHLPPRCRF